MTILFFGDVVGKIGRRALAKVLPKLKQQYKPDLILINGENLAHGKGITPKILREVLSMGVNALTTGNHVFARSEILPLLKDKNVPIVRPANYPAHVPGQGTKIIKVGNKAVLVINLLGRVFMHNDLDCPFRRIDQILKRYRQEKLVAILVDFHAEATSEKQALARYLDGRVSAVVGTHTHVATADTQILPKGTAFLCDIGMVGSQNSILGSKKEIVIQKFLTQMPQILEPAMEGPAIVDGVLIKIDPMTKQAISIKRIDQIVKF
ncbi:MAG: TIGR00282 family metallophosphoesterase [Candidatus Aenigmarchaeota archaeon]|nr:TIGR00282 family metallophosphoesterase [Candidatus Aenigmarchaeota archaeon]